MAIDGQNVIHDSAVGRVAGHVRGTDGRPVAGPTVTVIDPSGRQAGRVVGGADGGFALHVDVAGHYVLVASAEGHEPSAVAVIAGATPVQIEIVLGALLALTGLVMEASRGRPVAGATAAVTDVEGRVSLVQVTGADGSFTFTGLAAGQYTLVVSAEGSEPSAQTVTIGGTDAVDVTVVLHTIAELTGTVTDGVSGIPVANSQVVLLDLGGQMVASAITDDAGAYRFPSVIPSDYTVIANGFAPVAATVAIGSGTFVTREFVLGARTVQA